MNVNVFRWWREGKVSAKENIKTSFLTNSNLLLELSGKRRVLTQGERIAWVGAYPVLGSKHDCCPVCL